MPKGRAARRVAAALASGARRRADPGIGRDPPRGARRHDEVRAHHRQGGRRRPAGGHAGQPAPRRPLGARRSRGRGVRLRVGELADELPVSRPAVSQHLKVLKDAGLVTERAAGTRRIYRLNPAGVVALRDQIDTFWKRALADYQDVVEQPTEESQ